jgi:hypothetical protein
MYRAINRTVKLLMIDVKGEIYPMDRRMYRQNSVPCSKNTSPCRPNTPICGEKMGRYMPEDFCDREAECGDGSFNCFPLGMCYVPWQKFRNLYDNEFESLEHGTIFKELYLEFCERSCK